MERRGFFVAHRGTGGFHAVAQFAGQILVAAFQKQPHRAHRFGIAVIGGEALNARA